MAYTSGIATDYKDLLSILATFAAANGWTILYQTATNVCLRGEGSAALDEIYVNINAFESTGTYWNWGLNGSMAYRSGRAWNAHPRSSGSGKAYIYLWNSNTPYWMFATPRRLMVVAKVSTVYQLAHLGLLVPPATEAQYPYPMLIAGCGNGSTTVWSTTGTGNSIFANGQSSAGRVMVPGGEWVDLGTIAGTVQPASATSAQKSNILTAPDGSYLIEQIWMVDTTTTRPTILGQVDGLFRVSGYLNAAENLITIGGVNYLVVPDVYRSGYGDFLAVRMN
jgi:hypothetical protein